MFDYYENVRREIIDNIPSKRLEPFPCFYFHKILDMFDYEDVLDFLKNEACIKIPSNLCETFDPTIESDGLGTREQTYSISDYLDLASLTLPMKAVLGPLAFYGYVKKTSINNLQKEYSVYNLVVDHHMDKHPGVIKLKGMIGVLISNYSESKLTKDMVSTTVIIKQISKDELPDFMLSICMIQKVAIAIIVDDTAVKNVITKILLIL